MSAPCQLLGVGLCGTVSAFTAALSVTEVWLPVQLMYARNSDSRMRRYSPGAWATAVGVQGMHVGGG